MLCFSIRVCRYISYICTIPLWIKSSWAQTLKTYCLYNIRISFIQYAHCIALLKYKSSYVQHMCMNSKQPYKSVFIYWFICFTIFYEDVAFVCWLKFYHLSGVNMITYINRTSACFGIWCVFFVETKQRSECISNVEDSKKIFII